MVDYRLLIAGVALTLCACSKTDNGDVVVSHPSSVNVKTTQDTLHMPTMGTRTDTINTPTVGTRPETVIVNKPVFGTKRTAVQVPVVRN